MSHVARVNEACWCEWSMSHRWIRHVDVNVLICTASHCNTYCNTLQHTLSEAWRCEWNMSHRWMRHVDMHALTRTASHCNTHYNSHCNMKQNTLSEAWWWCEWGESHRWMRRKMIGLFCKRALWKRLYSAKKTYNFKEPTNSSHPIACRTYRWVMSQMWASHVARMDGHINVNESCLTYGWVMVAQVNETCCTYEWVMSQFANGR